jgi:hypothetical protein
LLPHGMILLCWWLRIFMEDNPYGIQNQSSFRIMELSGSSLYEPRVLMDSCANPRNRRPVGIRERQGHVRIHNNHSLLATFCRIQPLVANSYLV